MAQRAPRKKKPVVGDPTDPEGFGVWLRRYLEALRVKNYSERTVENRDVYLRFFVEWCEARGIVRPRDVTKPIVERYQRHLFHLRKDNGKLADLRIAFTGTNPRPVLLAGTAALCGGALDERVIKGLDALVRDQIMPMKTTFTPGHYRRRVAGVLARRLLTRLFES